MLPAAEELRCYAVCNNKQQAGSKSAAAVPPLRKGRLGGDDETYPDPPKGREHCY